MTAGTEISLYLIRNLGALLLFVVILRGVLHASRVNFYNPLSQMIVKLTNPLLTPLRGALPAAGRIDWAVWVLAVLLQSLILMGIASDSGGALGAARLRNLAAMGCDRRDRAAGQPLLFHTDRHDHCQLDRARKPPSCHRADLADLRTRHGPRPLITAQYGRHRLLAHSGVHRH